jgi:hypothetical protein
MPQNSDDCQQARKTLLEDLMFFMMFKRSASKNCGHEEKS